MIVHITLPEDWAAARNSGQYLASTRGVTMAAAGFLHASEDAAQVNRVGSALYSDRPDAFVVAMEEEALTAAGLHVRREPSDLHDPTSPLFPHVYGASVPPMLMRPIPRRAAEARVLREDDPKAQHLLDTGWSVESTSWGARLHLGDEADLSPYTCRVQDAEERGLCVRKLGAEDLVRLEALDGLVAPDFPHTPASHHDPLPADLSARIAGGDARAFGAFHRGELVGFTVVVQAKERWEVDRTAVDRRWRGQGVAQAVKASSVLDTYADGVRVWGTGGAAVNTASRRMNEALGFVLEPFWLALVPPVGWREYAESGPGGMRIES
ncbi:DUF952 domain-containing protein [Micrococcus sp. ACRRV]|uniref:GNAT family N-acetyltransferase n=1 Tax=Micrococcus sp. ACRRV TaxID=2918203 RepID=UPI001EF35974|nr:GNAT family N-acetyltransferase [Micrococcus sp. ACRRV]MCG7421450.1 DUF952 domain-containing protein [Micrococcus sp. ACRRV]